MRKRLTPEEVESALARVHTQGHYRPETTCDGIIYAARVGRRAIARALNITLRCICRVGDCLPADRRDVRILMTVMA